MSTAVEPKAQHYIPNFYLNGFTDRSRVLWVYEKFKPLRASKPKNEATSPTITLTSSRESATRLPKIP
jgi:hypothetical protein